jgi:hypothetical protein
VSKSFALDYIDVAERIQTFREKHPDGSLQQVSLDFREVGNRQWVIYTAAAYRSPDDQRPGIGTAWEPVPGATNFTRDSEVQNAETAAWGRAIVAALAGDTKRSIASAEEVRNRQAPAEPPAPDPLALVKAEVWAEAQRHGIKDRQTLASHFAEVMSGAVLADADEQGLRGYLETLKGMTA